jgi:hypothetical protein
MVMGFEGMPLAMTTRFECPISPGPAVGEQNLIYVIFLPTGSTTTESDDTGGYHKHAKHNANSSDDDLFWAVILTNPTWIDKTSSTKFVKSSSFIVSHELNEAFTDRDDAGFITATVDNCLKSVRLLLEMNDTFKLEEDKTRSSTGKKICA